MMMFGWFAIIENVIVSPLGATAVPAREITWSRLPVLPFTVRSWSSFPLDRTGWQFLRVPVSPATARPSTSGEPGPASTSNPATASHVRRLE